MNFLFTGSIKSKINEDVVASKVVVMIIDKILADSRLDSKFISELADFTRNWIFMNFDGTMNFEKLCEFNEPNVDLLLRCKIEQRNGKMWIIPLDITE